MRQCDGSLEKRKKKKALASLFIIVNDIKTTGAVPVGSLYSYRKVDVWPNEGVLDCYIVLIDKLYIG